MVGYGDIGQTCARLARVFGMRILAMRRRTDLSESERDSGLKVGLTRVGLAKDNSNPNPTLNQLEGQAFSL